MNEGTKPANLFRVSLNYTEGKAGLKIEWAALLEDGRELLRDSHVGYTGARPRDREKARDWNLSSRSIARDSRTVSN